MKANGLLRIVFYSIDLVSKPLSVHLYINIEKTYKLNISLDWNGDFFSCVQPSYSIDGD